MTNKFAHVKAAQVDPAVNHTCHFPGCKIQVPRAHWGCRFHWMLLPKEIRHRIWDSYQAGQEEHPELVSAAYLDASSAAQRWCQSYLAVVNAATENLQRDRSRG
jgi:hypothetical protein